MKGCLQSILFFVVVVVIINVIINLLDTGPSSEDRSYYDVGSVCDEFLQENAVTGDRIHQREWHVYERNETFCMGYESLDSINRSDELVRRGIRVRYTEVNFWGTIYAHLVEQGRHNLDYLADSLINVALEKSLSKMDLARLTVSFVQDIPYSFVLPVPCSEYETNGTPCLGGIPYGIISPYEFVHSMYGDCDTRAVLLYVLLEKMNYDPMIVVSNQYAHAMIALNMPAQGDHISFAGKKYYFWETTATGWPLGMLPPDTNNIDYWEIALVNES